MPKASASPTGAITHTVLRESRAASSGPALSHDPRSTARQERERTPKTSFSALPPSAHIHVPICPPLSTAVPIRPPGIPTPHALHYSQTDLHPQSIPSWPSHLAPSLQAARAPAPAIHGRDSVGDEDHPHPHLPNRIAPHRPSPAAAPWGRPADAPPTHLSETPRNGHRNVHAMSATPPIAPHPPQSPNPSGHAPRKITRDAKVRTQRTRPAGVSPRSARSGEGAPARNTCHNMP